MIKRKSFDTIIPLILGLILATILLIPQFQIKAGVNLSDTPFHFNRFFDIAEQFRNHNFSYLWFWTNWKGGKCTLWSVLFLYTRIFIIYYRKLV